MADIGTMGQSEKATLMADQLPVSKNIPQPNAYVTSSPWNSRLLALTKALFILVLATAAFLFFGFSTTSDGAVSDGIAPARGTATPGSVSLDPVEGALKAAPLTGSNYSGSYLTLENTTDDGDVNAR